MKYFVLVLVLVSSLFSFEWSADYNKALSEAKVEHKDVYVFIGSAYCKYCEKMKETTFSDPAVIKKLAKSYVYIYLSKDIDDIPEKFTIPYTPAHYFLSSDGKIIYSTVGYKSKAVFFDILDDVKALKSS